MPTRVAAWRYTAWRTYPWCAHAAREVLGRNVEQSSVVVHAVLLLVVEARLMEKRLREFLLARDGGNRLLRMEIVVVGKKIRLREVLQNLERVRVIGHP